MSRNVERVLDEIGQFPRPMNEAPRDGRKILGQSTRGGLIICYWDAWPSKLAGPIWVEAPDAERGYLDRYFTGWLDPAKLLAQVKSQRSINRFRILHGRLNPAALHRLSERSGLAAPRRPFR